MKIEELVEIFSRHEIQAEKNRKETLASFIENNPNVNPPKEMKDDFNFPQALKLMCMEILSIKKEIQEKNH